jgi:hypothetical protein
MINIRSSVIICPVVRIDVNGTLKATEHDKYENIAHSVRLSPVMVRKGKHITWPGLSATQYFTPVGSAIYIYSKRYYAYGKTKRPTTSCLYTRKNITNVITVQIFKDKTG